MIPMTGLPSRIRGLRRLAALGGLLAVLLGATTVAAAPWPERASDLAPDPALRSGTLANGLRYAVRPHGFPAGRVALRLVVAVGSREEREEERGLAHFLEHMAFRGTKAYPRGELMPALERLGIAPGPDNTAFTYYDHTTYILELPDPRPAMLRQGLGVFREVAEGITFDADLIELERAVVLNEKSLRNTPQAREHDANRNFLWPTAREIRRSPIGLADTVSNLTRAHFVAFYDAWYRPERMAVIVTGDIDPDDAVAMVREIFGPLQARAPARPEPTGLVAVQANDGRVGIYREDAIVGAGIMFEHPLPNPPRPDTADNRREGIQRGVAIGMFYVRLRELAQREAGVITSPNTSLEDPVQDWLLASFSSSGRTDNWRQVATAMEQELRRAKTHGFTAEEFRQAVSSYRAHYDAAVRTADTRESSALAAGLEQSFLSGLPFVTPETARDSVRPILDALTPEDCLAAFRRAWGEGTPRVFIGSNSSLPIGIADVARVLEASRQVEVAPPQERAAVTLAYSDFGPAGALRRVQAVAGLDLRLAEFGNRVRLNFKPTAFDQGFVSFVARIGNGRQGLPVRGLDTYANSVFVNGGLGRHAAADLSSIFAGHNVDIRFSVQDDALLFSGRCAREDLLLSLRLVAAYLTDAAYRPEGLRNLQSDVSTIYSSFTNSPGGVVHGQLEFLLSGGDQRFGLPDAGQILGRSHTELAAWLTPQLRSGPVELSVVGDTSWEEASAAVAATLGALPPRSSRGAEPNRPVKFVPGGLVRTFASAPSLRQANVTLVFPIPDAVDVHQERRCQMLAEVLDERIRIALREELGATYTPSVNFVQNQGFEGFDYIQFSADVLPTHFDRVAPVIRREIATLQREGIGADLFSRVRETILRQRENELRTNAYWLYTALDGIQQYPAKLAAVRDRTADYAGITAGELNAVARRYLIPAESYMFTAIPETAAPR